MYEMGYYRKRLAAIAVSRNEFPSKGQRTCLKDHLTTARIKKELRIFFFTKM
jgi:hypothetical protein